MSDGVPDVDALRRDYIGQESPPEFMDVEKGHVRAFAEAIEDPNPLWSDDVQARKSRFGGIVAPPTFLRAARTQRLEDLPRTSPISGCWTAAASGSIFSPFAWETGLPP